MPNEPTQEEFCKLFTAPELGQILVKIDSNDEGKPEVRFFIQPKYLGVCAIAMEYNDDDDGWAKADKYFSSVGVEEATRVATEIDKTVRGEFGAKR